MQSGENENFLFNPIALNLFPLVKASTKGFPYTCKINPKVGLAEQWGYDS